MLSCENITIFHSTYPSDIFLFRVDNGITKNNLWNLFKCNNKGVVNDAVLGVLDANFEQISHIVLVYDCRQLHAAADDDQW